MLRAGPSASSKTRHTPSGGDGPALHIFRPEVRATLRLPARAQNNFAAFVAVMKDAFGSRHKKLLYLVPPQCRIPLGAGTLGTGDPAASSQMSSCRRRNPVGPSAARCTKHNSVLCPEPVAAGTNHCTWPTAKSPGPPSATQCSRQPLLHPSRQPLHSASVVFD